MVNNKKVKSIKKTLTGKDKNMTISQYKKFRGSANHQKELEELIGYLQMDMISKEISMLSETSKNLEKLIKEHNQFILAEAIGVMLQRQLKKD